MASKKDRHQENSHGGAGAPRTRRSSAKTRTYGTAISWDEIPHAEIRRQIYARLDRNSTARSREDSAQHIRWRQLRTLDPDVHVRFIESKAHDLVEHLRCTRDVYREYVNEHNLQPILEAYWVVLRCAVFPTAIRILQDSIFDYLKQTGVRARDLSLLFGVLTRVCRTNEPGFPLLIPDSKDDSVANDDELKAVARLPDQDALLWFRDISDGGAVGYPFGDGPFALNDALAIRRSFMIVSSSGRITLPEWIPTRQKLWEHRSPWTRGLCNLFGCAQEELLDQWRALPPDSLIYELERQKKISSFVQIAVPQEDDDRRRGRPKSKIVAARREVIRRVAAKGCTGEAYCRELDIVFLSTPLEWQKEGIPKSYSDAWNDPDLNKQKKWRQRISDEKSKATSHN